MIVCFFGMGSIGQRHARNLRTVCEAQNLELTIDVFRQTERPLPDDIVKAVRTVRNPAELCARYDAIFITNPTNMHHQTLTDNAGRADFFFVEKPLFERPRSLPVDEKSVYVACPMRYGSVIAQLKQILEKERIFSVVATCSSYLPLWRKDDYRYTYSAHKDMGGGVSIDLIHEIDYLCHLFGKPEKVHLEKGKYSTLEIDSDDVAVYHLVYQDKLALVYLDYFGVSAQRDLILRGQNAVIHADFLYNTIIIKRLDGNGETFRWEEAPNDKYLREMKRFIDWMDGKTHNQNDAGLANDILALAIGENT